MRLLTLLFAGCMFVMISCGGAKEKTSPGGHPYTLHKDAGGQKPQEGDIISFHAVQRTADSVLYDSREMGQPQKMKVQTNPNKSAIEDVISVLGVGDSATVSINLDTVPNLPEYLADAHTLYFDVVVTDIQSAADFEAQQEKEKQEKEAAASVYREREEEVATKVKEDLQKYKSGSWGDQLKETPSGLKYVIHEQGSGTKPSAGEVVDVAYYGVLTDGTMFDNSYGRGEPISFPVGQQRVIAGWDEGIPLLNEGGKATLFIPYELAYGEQGSPPVIPPKAELVFYVELVNVQ